MAGSIFIPLLVMPADTHEIRSAVDSAFAEFDLPSPKTWRDNKDLLVTSLSEGFVMIEGAESGCQCWVSISRCAAELAGNEECSILADVKTRGSWLFAAVVSYAFCKTWGHTVFNDAGELDGQESYSAESLKEVIRKLACPS